MALVLIFLLHLHHHRLNLLLHLLHHLYLLPLYLLCLHLLVFEVDSLREGTK